MAATFTGVRLGQVAARLGKHVELALASVDLTPSQYGTLCSLAEGPTGASRLASWLAVSRPSVTATVDALVARGLVERREDPADRRRVEHLLTTEGSRALDAAELAIEARFAELLVHVGAGHASRARRGLEAWREPLDAYRDAHLPR